MRQIILIAAVAGLLCAAEAASAELVYWHIDGSITGVSGPYLPTGDPGPTAAQQAASQNALALFPVGSSYSTEFTVDLEAPHTPASGSASFEGSIKSFNFSVPGSGFSFSSSQPVNQGVSITPQAPNGDAIYFYLPSGLSLGNQPPSLLASFQFVDPNGSLNTNPDLHHLFNSFDTSTYSFMGGGATVYQGSCRYLTCGSIELAISNASVSPVPLPSSAVVMLSGLCATGWLLWGKRLVRLA